MKKKILFISHDATRTGAPILLLNLLKYFKINSSGFEFRLLLKKGGEMQEDFQNCFPSTITLEWHFYRFRFIGALIRKIHRFLNFQRAIDYKPDLIFANTVVCSDLIKELKKTHSSVPVIMHVHELQMSIERYIGEEIFRDALPFIDKFICASEKVRINLLENYSIAEEKLVKIYEYIDTSAEKEVLDRDKGQFRIVSCGTMDWRKSPQLFVEIAGMVNRRLSLSDNNIVFTWIGGNLNSIEYAELNYDIERLKIKNSVRFVGGMKNPKDEFVKSDLFLLTSREDPYPLVCLEAALCGTPIICFDLSGGIPEFVEQDAGWVLPYLDLEAVVEKIIYLFHHREELKTIGCNAQKKVVLRHSIQKAALDITHVINSL